MSGDRLCAAQINHLALRRVAQAGIGAVGGIGEIVKATFDTKKV